jgi:uncharacterized protein (TIRG00374 family)
MQNEEESSKKKKKLGILLRSAFSLILITALLYSIGLAPIIKTFASIKLFEAFLAFISHVLIFVFGAINIWLLLEKFKNINFSEYFKYYTYAWAISLISPSHAGDVSLLYFLKKKGIPYSVSGTCYSIDKFISFNFFLIISFYGLKILLPNVGFAIPTASLTGIYILFFLFLYFILKTEVKNKYLLVFKSRLLDTSERLSEIKSKSSALLINFLITVIKWLCVCLGYWAAFKAFGYDLPIEMAGVIPIMSTMVGYIPITLGGIGTVELSAVYLFSLIGVPAETVLSVYIMLRVFQYSIGAIGLLSVRSKV